MKLFWLFTTLFFLNPNLALAKGKRGLAGTVGMEMVCVGYLRAPQDYGYIPIALDFVNIGQMGYVRLHNFKEAEYVINNYWWGFQFDPNSNEFDSPILTNGRSQEPINPITVATQDAQKDGRLMLNISSNEGTLNLKQQSVKMKCASKPK